MRKGIVISCIIICMTFVFANGPRTASHKPLPKLRGDEKIDCNKVNISYPNILSRGREQIIVGTTAYDFQASGGFGQRITLDSYLQAHMNWMRMDMAQVNRYCAWNARYFDSSYYGETQASPSWSGYVQLDVTRDSNPDYQRTVIAFHYDAGSGYYSWIDIDAGNLWGAWPNNPSTPGVPGHIWPYVAVANNGNIVMATGNMNEDVLHLYITFDEGNTWAPIAYFDSCACLSQFLRSSINSWSNKVVFVWTQFITDTIAGGQLDNDVWYMLSEDGGITWGQRVNITNYQSTDSVRAYSNVNAIFDRSDNLHIVWAGRKVTDDYYQASKIFHWDEVSNSISIVSSPSTYYNEPGGWWIATATSAVPGAWRLPADQPQLSVKITDGEIVCFWCGNDDYNDGSASGFFNGEIYVAISSDNGTTWTPYFNVTNTRSPGAGPGECMDEDYLTVYPMYDYMQFWMDGVYTYILDKDAGAAPHNEGVFTQNPVYCYYYWLGPGCKEKRQESDVFEATGPTIFSGALRLPTGRNSKLFDITGRVVMSDKIKPGIYFIEIDGQITKKVIKVR